jgi:hypothetical protein
MSPSGPDEACMISVPEYPAYESKSHPFLDTDPVTTLPADRTDARYDLLAGTIRVQEGPDRVISPNVANALGQSALINLALVLVELGVRGIDWKIVKKIDTKAREVVSDQGMRVGP